MSVYAATLVLAGRDYHIMAAGQDVTPCGVMVLLPMKAGSGVVACAACREALSDDRSDREVFIVRDNDGLLHATRPVIFTACSVPEKRQPLLRAFLERVRRCDPLYLAHHGQVEEQRGTTCLECLAVGGTP